MKYFLIFGFILYASLVAEASFIFNDNCKQAYTDVMCLRFSQAETRIQTEQKHNPANAVPALIENYIGFLKVMIGEEEKDFIHLKENKDKRLQKLALSGKESPWFLYSQSVIYLQSGMARVKFGEYVNAGLDINRAYRLLIENQRKFPDFVMNKAGLGILHSLIGTVPDKYRWAVRSLNFEGTIPQGTSEIKEAYRLVSLDPQLSFLLPETAFLLTFVTLNLSADVPAALALAEKFKDTPLAPFIKESPLVTYALASIYSRAGENDKAIRILTERPRSADRYQFYYLDYMLGVARLNRLDKDACYPLLNFLGNFKGKNYIRSAYMHLAWYYLIQNNLQQYNYYVERIKLRGNDQVDNDLEALSFAAKNSKPDLTLLKARLLFDGGYYERAISELEGYTSADAKNNLEHTYRLGRIYHKQGKQEEAIRYYKATIKDGEKLRYYYAANSALQLGLMFEKRKDYKLAKIYFSKVLDMEFDEYQFSIKNKAQAGMNRIKGF
jgi:tetratricopeptide (TPR) repeat protein